MEIIRELEPTCRGPYAGAVGYFDYAGNMDLCLTILPECLLVTATSEDGEIMGIRHRDYPAEGVQFHPESILTEKGDVLIKNFLTRIAEQRERMR